VPEGERGEKQKKLFTEKARFSLKLFRTQRSWRRELSPAGREEGGESKNWGREGENFSRGVYQSLMRTIPDLCKQQRNPVMGKGGKARQDFRTVGHRGRNVEVCRKKR